MIHKRLQESDYPLERIRLSYTNLTQDDFAVACGIPRATYHRIVKKPIQEIKFSLGQIRQIAKTCDLTTDELIAALLMHK